MRRYLSWIEGLTTNQNVTGSNPVRRTTRYDKGRQSSRLTALLLSGQSINNGRDFANTANSTKRQPADTIGQRMPDNQIPLTLEWLTCHGTHSNNVRQARAPSKTHGVPAFGFSRPMAPLYNQNRQKYALCCQLGHTLILSATLSQVDSPHIKTFSPGRCPTKIKAHTFGIFRSRHFAPKRPPCNPVTFCDKRHIYQVFLSQNKEVLQ